MHATTLLVLAAGAKLATAIPLAPRASVWQPAQMTSWQIILSDVVDASNTVTPSVDVFDIDLFDTDKDTITALKNQGKKVLCYFSAGSYEPNRPDSSDFRSSDLGKVMDGWPDEKWLNIKSDNVKQIMSKRIQLAADKGCDGVDPDNVDGYSNSNGLNLKSSDSVTYIKYLASQASSANLAIGLKNAVDIIPQVVGSVQFAVNEQCHAYQECNSYAPFTAANKAVFNVEYPNSAPTVNVRQRNTACGATGAAHLSTIIKMTELNGWAEFCDASTARTATAA